MWAFDIRNGFNEDLFADARSEGIASFGEDNSGEIIHIDLVAGAISRIEGSGAGTGVSGPPEKLSQMGCFTAALDDQRASIAERAQSYIHVNCASCHRGAGGSQSIWDARFTTPFAAKGLCRTSPVTPVTDKQPEYYVSPGDHQSSSIWWRVHVRGSEQMPPIGSYRVDTTGAALLAQWINGLSEADCE